MQTLFLIRFKNRCKIGLEEFFKRELLFKRTKYKKKIPKLKFLKKGTNLIKTRSRFSTFHSQFYIDLFVDLSRRLSNRLKNQCS